MTERVTYTELREAKERYVEAWSDPLRSTSRATGDAYITALEAVLAQTEAALHKVTEEAATNVSTIRRIEGALNDKWFEAFEYGGALKVVDVEDIRDILNRHKKDGKS